MKIEFGFDEALIALRNGRAVSRSKWSKPGVPEHGPDQLRLVLTENGTCIDCLPHPNPAMPPEYVITTGDVLARDWFGWGPA
jgi:hypothetical protein